MLFSLSALFLFSCEDVIELDLNTTEPRVIIEANLDASTNRIDVLLSYSNDFYENGEPSKISNANIILSTASGENYVLSEVADGLYTQEGLNVVADESVELQIDIDEESYTATSHIPHPVELLSIEQLEGGPPPIGGQENANIILAPEWMDPIDIENYYRVKPYINDTLLVSNYSIVDDTFRGDGNPQRFPIMEPFQEGDEVTLELLSTDKAYYDYFLQLANLAGNGGGSTTPYNPKGNFDNGALGYFGAFHASRITVQL